MTQDHIVFNSPGITYGKKVKGGFVFGDLRRSAKTHMATAGVDSAHRDAIVGHTPPGMDKHYMKPRFEDLQVAMSTFTDWLATEIAAVAKIVAKSSSTEKGVAA